MTHKTLLVHLDEIDSIDSTDFPNKSVSGYASYQNAIECDTDGLEPWIDVVDSALDMGEIIYPGAYLYLDLDTDAPHMVWCVVFHIGQNDDDELELVEAPNNQTLVANISSWPPRTK